MVFRPASGARLLALELPATADGARQQVYARAPALDRVGLDEAREQERRLVVAEVYFDARARSMREQARPVRVPKKRSGLVDGDRRVDAAPVEREGADGAQARLRRLDEASVQDDVAVHLRE
ncbi:MAG: hypothetical protein M3444_01365 [Acidobacteriota bacterium]|nr:hypothetical protein [Acidobacteriota bacterium]